MKAIVTTAYGSVDVLEQQEIEKPIIQNDELLIQVQATSVNPVDWKIRRGNIKLLTGRKPPKMLGTDYSGIVVEIGKTVTKFQIGDAAFGMAHPFKGGTYAEYIKIKESKTCLKPQNLSFEEAASLPVVAITAYQAMVYEARFEKGQHIMINGCSGGVGLAAVQIAKALGGTVTGVCSSKNIETVKQLNVDHVIDYTTRNILEHHKTYDIFFDVVGNQSFFKVKPTLKTGGIYVSALPSFQTMVLAPLINLFSSKQTKKVLASCNANDLAIIKAMAEHGTLKPIIEKSYPIEQIKEAHLHSETGRVVGKIVIKGFSK